jgi:hypothetical protein
VVVEVIVSCPEPQFMRIVEVVITSNEEAGETMHAEYRWNNGPYTSPLQSSLVTYISGIANPLVSRYNVVTGYAGSPGFPPGGSVMSIQYNKINFDTRSFNPLSDKFKYLRSSVLYNNTSPEINTLLGLATDAAPILGSGNTYYADFTVPPASSGDNLYLIWDLRKSTQIQMCYSENINDVCCDCNTCPTNQCVYYQIEALGVDAEVEFNNGWCGESEPYTVLVDAGDTIEVCVNTVLFNVISGNPILTLLECNCTGCEGSCNTWIFENTGEGEAAVEYTLCAGSYTIEKIDVGASISRCVSSSAPSPAIIAGEVNMTYTCGCP